MPRIKKLQKQAGKGTVPQSRFERHPGKTLFAFVLAVALVLDFSAGLVLIPADYHSFRRPHPVYHHGFYPNMNTSAKWGDRVYPMVTNSMGFRDGSAAVIPLRSPKTRIVLMGDSFTESLGVSFKESFSGKLQTALEKRGVEVLNAGAVSYSPKLYYLKTKYLIEQEALQFQELIVLIDISDIQDEILYQSFEPGEESLYEIFSAKIHKKAAGISFLYFSFSRMLGRFRKGSEALENQTRWADIDVWKARLNPRLMEDIGYYKVRGLWTIDSSIFKQWGERGLKLATQNMSRLAALCKENRIRITLVVYPWPEQIYYNDLDSIQVRHWEQFAKQHQAGFINLFPFFMTGEDPRTIYENYFIPGDEHWNERGHTLVADALLAGLRSRDGEFLRP